MSTLNLNYLKHPSSSTTNLTLNDDGSTVITPSVQTTARNKIINGSFAVDQRNAGGSQTVTAGAALAYTCDRWYAYCTGANVTGQRIAGSAPFQYYYRFTGAASNTAVGFGTRLEAADTFHLAGQTATLSVYAASSSITTLTWTAYYANTTDSFGTLASPTRTQIATGTFTINSTLARKSVQISVPSAATTGIEVVFTVGALLGSQTLTFAGVQLEVGPVATPFEFEPFETTLRKCQRYFRTITGFAASAVGANPSLVDALIETGSMRAADKAVGQTGTFYALDPSWSGGGSQSPASISIVANLPGYVRIRFNNFSGLTGSKFYWMYGATTGLEVVTLSAEM